MPRGCAQRPFGRAAPRPHSRPVLRSPAEGGGFRLRPEAFGGRVRRTVGSLRAAKADRLPEQCETENGKPKTGNGQTGAGH